MSTASIRLDQELVDKAAIMAKALNRTTPKQIEHWAKIGEMMEDNPDLPYEFVKQAIIAKAEKEADAIIASWPAEDPMQQITYMVKAKPLIVKEKVQNMLKDIEPPEDIL